MKLQQFLDPSDTATLATLKHAQTIGLLETTLASVKTHLNEANLGTTGQIPSVGSP